MRPIGLDLSTSPGASGPARGAVHNYLAARAVAHRAFAGRGIGILDVLPARLPISIVNRHLDIKRSGSL